jgi:hypothetical protein
VRRALGAACGLLLTLFALLSPAPARADGSYPGSRQILLPAERPEQLILATNFGLILSEDAGRTWSFSCERELNAYAGPYLLGTAGSQRIFALTAGAGLIHSDDASCGWQAAGGALSDVLPYTFAVDPSSSARVYAIGVPRQDLRGGDSIYVSDDGGVSFGPPVFTAPARSALLSILVAPSRPNTIFATLFSTPQNHPSLLRSDDSGEHWEDVADLADALGENPFELLAIDPLDDTKLYARVLGPSAETLAISNDGGLGFVQSVSIPGKLNAFLQLASGTLLVAGTTGIQGVGYRSKDGGRTFEVWPTAPHVHALAERSGKLYVAGDSYADGYALAESEDEGNTLQPLLAFEQVSEVTACVADACAESCAYYAGIGLWPSSVCGVPAEPAPGAVSEAGAPGVDTAPKATETRLSGGGCACNLARGFGANAWNALVLVAVAGFARRRVKSRPGIARATGSDGARGP